MRVKFEVRITPSAEKDLEGIWTYVAADSRKKATDFILALEKQISTLECFPERCSLISENEVLNSAYRHLIHGNYRTIFRIEGKRVYILRILHGSRLLDSSLLGVSPGFD